MKMGLIAGQIDSIRHNRVCLMMVILFLRVSGRICRRFYYSIYPRLLIVLLLGQMNVVAHSGSIRKYSVLMLLVVRSSGSVHGSLCPRRYHSPMIDVTQGIL
jgi:hypothetical protein